MTQIIYGVCALAVGFVLALYGNYQNNDLEAQLSSLWYNGTANPGDVWLYAGIAVAVVGLVVLIIGIKNYNQGTGETKGDAGSSAWRARMIKEYEAQRKNGVITQAEFDQKCAEIQNS